ncbi:MAG TPA: hypothetical protein VFP77_11065 [Gemmatimonadaceae bacterium]|nr:hypothetical protein [Gemmatimonadaceae bacterium]
MAVSSCGSAIPPKSSADALTRPKRTGHIDHDVATYMRDHGYDLRYYLAQHW